MRHSLAVRVLFVSVRPPVELARQLICR